MTDAAIKATTGKDWAAWFAALDKAGAAKLDHAAIARLAAEEMGAGDWYGQMIAVSYERARGIRAMNQKCDGEFSVSVTRVMNAPLPELFAAATASARPGFPKGHSRKPPAPRTNIGAANGNAGGWTVGFLCQGRGQGADRADSEQAAQCGGSGKGARRCGRRRSTSSRKSSRPDAASSFHLAGGRGLSGHTPRPSSFPSVRPNSMVPTACWAPMRCARRSSPAAPATRPASWSVRLSMSARRSITWRFPAPSPCSPRP